MHQKVSPPKQKGKRLTDKEKRLMVPSKEKEAEGTRQAYGLKGYTTMHKTDLSSKGILYSTEMHPLFSNNFKWNRAYIEHILYI